MCPSDDDETKDAAVTYHARRRFKERAKLPPRAARRAAQKALEFGMDENHPDLSPALRGRLLRSKNNPEHVSPNPDAPYKFRVYCGLLYIFKHNNALITVLPGFDNPDDVKLRPADLPEKVFIRGERCRAKHHSKRYWDWEF
jgi:hypothetical protein